MKMNRNNIKKGKYGVLAVSLLFGMISSCGGGSDEASVEPSDSQADIETSAPMDTAASAGDPVADGIAYAQEQLAKYTAEPGPFEAPGPAVDGDIASLKGGEIWFIPIAYQFVPYFAVQEAGLKEAFGEIGMTVRTCDAAADPTIAAKCVDDAVTAGAKAIVTGAVTYPFAPNAFDAAKKAGVKIIYGDGGYPSETGNNDPWEDGVAYVSFNGALATSIVADWMIVDSKGTANVLAIRVSDTDWTKATMSSGAVKEFASYCPNCKVVVVDSNAAQTPERPSVVAGAIAANPDTNYVLPNFDSTVAPSGALEGVQNAGYLEKIKGGTTTGQLPGLKLISEGRFLNINVGQNVTQEAWAGADQAIRLLLGNAAAVDPVVQLRAFTAEVVAGLELTEENASSGIFFGNTGFKDVYRKLWGL